MSHGNREPARWLESDLLSDELARELAAYGGAGPSVESKARMAQQLSAQLGEALAPAVAKPVMLKLKLLLGSAAALAGVVGFMQFAQPVPTARVADVRVQAEPLASRVAPLALTTFAPSTELRDEVSAAVVDEVEPARSRQARGQRVEPARAIEPSVAIDVVPSKAPAERDTAGVIEELTMLARARRALLNEPDRALSLCEEHDRRFPHGTFEEEREVLAIESLLKLSRGAEARTRAIAFEARFPRSSHVSHLAKIIAKPAK